MKLTTAQRFLMASGILVLLGSGSCYIALNFGDVMIGLAGIAALLLAVVLGIIGLIGALMGTWLGRGEDTYRYGLRLKEKAQRLPDSDESTG